MRFGLFLLLLAPPSSASALTASSIKLHAVDVGSRLPSTAPPIVIVHGLLGSGSNFATWAKSLAATCQAEGTPRRVLLCDLRNHGESSHCSDMSFDEMAADVVQLLDDEGISRAVLFGHSIGGKVAMATALRHRERVERLCVIDIAPTTYDTSEAQWASVVEVIAAMRSIDLRRVTTKKDADQQLSRTVADPGMRAFVLTNLMRTPSSGDKGPGLRWRVNLPAIEESLPELASWPLEEGTAAPPPYEGNTLFIAGGKSRFLRSSHLPEIQGSFSHFSLSTIRTAAHWVHADEPDALLVIASSFLASKSVANA